MFRGEIETKNKSRKGLKNQSKEWWPNYINKINKIKYLGMKFKKKTSKSIKNKTNSYQRNKKQNWSEHQLEDIFNFWNG